MNWHELSYNIFFYSLMLSSNFFLMTNAFFILLMAYLCLIPCYLFYFNSPRKTYPKPPVPMRKCMTKSLHFIFLFYGFLSIFSIAWSESPGIVGDYISSLDYLVGDVLFCNNGMECYYVMMICSGLCIRT